MQSLYETKSKNLPNDSAVFQTILLVTFLDCRSRDKHTVLFRRFCEVFVDFDILTEFPKTNTVHGIS